MRAIDLNLKLKIRGWGRSWPSGSALTNLELLGLHPDTKGKPEAFLKELAERIERIYGTRQRHLTRVPGRPHSEAALSNEETSETLALDACRRALAVVAAAPSTGARVPDAFVLGSTTSARYTGSMAAAVQGQLGFSAPAYELKSGCSTSLMSLQMAYGLIKLGYPSVLVSCAETLSKVINPKIRETWFGFADGAAALWLDASDTGHGGAPDFEINRIVSSTDGELVDLYTTPGKLPPREDELAAGRYFMEGDSAVMKDHALVRYTKLLDALLPDASDRRAIRWIVGHQVNRQLSEEVVAQGGLGGELVWPALEFGNVGGASVLFTLATMLEEKRFKPGDRVLLMSVGGGMSYAAQLWRAL